MPVVEKYGLMILFGLCALIVGVGIFAEDPLTAKAQEQMQERRADKGVLPASNEMVFFSDSSTTLGDGETGPLKTGLRPMEMESDFPDLDPAREKSLNLIPEKRSDIREEPLAENPRAKTKVRTKAESKPKVELSYYEYKVRKGDSLSRIAEKQLGSKKYLGEIRRANPQIKKDKIFANKMIRIPVLPGSKKGSVAQNRPGQRSKKGAAEPRKDRRITVKAGETLEGIAKRYYGNRNKWKALARHNGIKKDKIFAGKKLFVPADL